MVHSVNNSGFLVVRRTFRCTFRRLSGGNAVNNLTHLHMLLESISTSAFRSIMKAAGETGSGVDAQTFLGTVNQGYSNRRLYGGSTSMPLTEVFLAQFFDPDPQGVLVTHDFDKLPNFSRHSIAMRPFSN